MIDAVLYVLMAIATIVPMIVDVFTAALLYLPYPEDITGAEIAQSLVLSLCYCFDSIAFLLVGFLVYKYVVAARDIV